MAGEGIAVSVGGVERLKAVARRMDAVDRRDLRRELTKGLRRGANPIVAAQRREVRSLSGAPSEWKRGAAKATRLTVRTSGRSAGVRIRVKKGTDISKPARNMNRGHWRHPLFGDREHWYDQRVRPGWFDRPPRKGAPHVRRELQKVLDDIADKIEG